MSDSKRAKGYLLEDWDIIKYWLDLVKRRNIDKYKTKDYSNYNIKRGMHLASLFLYIKFLQINSLEVVVNTESNVVAIKACTPSVSIYAWTLLLNRLPTSETYVSNEANLLVEVYSDTWLQTCWPCVNLAMIVCLTQTTINESVNVLRVYKCVTNVRLYGDVVT